MGTFHVTWRCQQELRSVLCTALGRRGGEGCSGIERTMGGIKGINSNFNCSFPVLSTSILYLTASNLGSAFPVLDLCEAQIVMNIRQRRQYSSC